jgi:hypothetical protein
MMKTSIRIAWPVTLALTLALAVSAVIAAEPGSNTPDQAPYIDTQLHSVAAHDSDWYKFDFVLDHPGFICHFIACPDKASYHGQAEIRLQGLAKSGLNFAIYAPAQMRDWQKQEPVGMGNQDGDDLVWVGGADSSGTWYVRVINNMSNPLDYRFTIDGAGVAVSRTVEDPATRPTPMGLADWLEAQRAPTPTPTPVVGNTTPDRAGGIDGNAHTLAAQSELWYTIGFSQDRATVRLLDGAARGLAFDVYMPGQLATWWKEDPLGRGTVDGSDLVWTGEPNGVYTRYIRVVNKTNQAVEFTLRVVLPLKQPAPVPSFLR